MAKHKNMNNRQFIAAACAGTFQEKAKRYPSRRHASRLWEADERSEIGILYSYGHHYPLAWKINGQLFRNIQGYSITTAKHIGQVYPAMDIKLTDGLGHGSLVDICLAAMQKEAFKLGQEFAALRPRQNRKREAIEARMKELAGIDAFFKGLPPATARASNHVEDRKRVYTNADVMI
jgi:hypothetical protein